MLTEHWFTFRAGGPSWKGMLVIMGGVCRGGMSRSLIPVLSGCSQVRRAGPGCEAGGGVMVGRRDWGGMTIWWSSSTRSHSPLRVSPTHSVTPLHACVSGTDMGSYSAG